MESESRDEFQKKLRQKVKNEIYLDVSKKVLNKINLTRKEVLKVCDEHPDAIHSYSVLVTRFHERELERKNVPKRVHQLTDEEREKYLTSPDAIDRAFRKINEWNDYDLRERYDTEEEGYREGMGKMKKEVKE